MSELETAHGTRIQELLCERRKEKEKEQRRHKVALDRAGESLAAREQIYKERIRGLEEQIEMLRDQLGKELRRRQIFIEGTSGINQDISQLRANLDESLHNVSADSVRHISSHDLGRTLDRESNRLHQITQDYVNMPNSIGVQSVKNQFKDTRSDNTNFMENAPTTNVKRTLSFENIVT